MPRTPGFDYRLGWVANLWTGDPVLHLLAGALTRAEQDRRRKPAGADGWRGYRGTVCQLVETEYERDDDKPGWRATGIRAYVGHLPTLRRCHRCFPGDAS